MNNRVFQFGEHREGFAVPVLNERAVRAGAGILFFFALATFMTAFLTGNFQPTRVFVVAFLIEFAIRIFVNPRFAPTMVIGQWVTRRQQPEWVGAPQKRFAWGIGLALAVAMFFLMVVNNVVGPINMIICSLCLILMFFETAFGICIGCAVYNLLHKNQAQLCPGGVCEAPPDPALRPGLGAWAVVAAFSVVVAALAPHVAGTRTPPWDEPAQTAPLDAAEAERCKVPEFAKAMGHEKMWKQHNGCR